MNKLAFVLLFLATVYASSIAQLYPEPPFGLDLPVNRWTALTDEQYLGGPRYGRLGVIEDIESLRFQSVEDTTEIILMLDGSRGQIHWLRCSATDYPRPVDWFGTYGRDWGPERDLWAPCAMAVSSGASIYDDAEDYIYVADWLFHRIRAYRFRFYSSGPSSDGLEWQFDIAIDPHFYPSDLNYIDYDTGLKSDNRLLAIDTYGERLFVFSHNGQELYRFDISSLGQPPFGLYSNMTNRLGQFGNIYAYLVDYVHADVDLVKISPAGNLEYLNGISIGDNGDTVLTDVVYSEQFGLWAVESEGPRLYQLAPDLSRIIREINGENFNPAQMLDIKKIIIHPERLIVLEDLKNTNGILSFATVQRSPKKDTDEELIPYRFALSQNYPNPFNPSTIINYEIPVPGFVTLKIYNILGQEVKILVDSYQNAGAHSVIWNGDNNSGKKTASGIYFSKLSSGENTEIKKMLLLK
jgi:hypothetical protein